MRRIQRRTFLKGAGVAIGLPFLEASLPSRSDAANSEGPIRRMVLMEFGFGFYAPYLIPKKIGYDYELTPYLEVLKEFRQDLTIISGTSHPDVDGGHLAVKSFLTAAPKPRSTSFKNTISVDQLAAERIGIETRFRSLTLGGSISYSRNGAQIPAEHSPSRLFAKLFLDGSLQERQRQIQRLKDQQSVMDAVLDEARSMRTRASKLDGDTLDQYFTSVRETEQSLAKSQAWEMNPKPHVDVPRPKDITNTRDIIERARLMFDMTHLALQSDSTRLITIAISGMNAIPHIQGVTQDYHSLSHHGQDPERLSELKIIELEQLKLVAQFLGKLRGTVERDKTLLNQTMVMMGSELGNANSHDNHNLPILLAGGGFRHGQHLAFDPNRNCPLANLFVSMLQQLGLPIEKFASSTGTMSGLNT